jgi:hypothetical protein
MTWLIWLCGGWLAFEGLLRALGRAGAIKKYPFGGRRKYDCAPLAPLAALMIAHWLPPALIFRGGPPGHPRDARVTPL